MIYWDSSALVKQFVTESGTEEVLALRREDPPHATAIVTYVETFLALRRRVRERALSEARYRVAIDQFLRDWPALVRARLDEDLIAEAAKLIERHPLRTLDAIHLASALKLQHLLGEAFLLVSADNQLLHAATAERLAVRHIQL